MKRIGIVLGTRPEAIKLIPVYLALKARPEFEVSLISTGQHKEMLQQIFSFFEVSPSVDFELMRSNQTLEGLTARLVESLGAYLREHPQDALVVQGDTTTCMAGALVGFYQKAKIIHVEAGLRTYNKYSPFPEEVNRKITGVIADIHFTPTPRAENALKLESITENVFTVGNTVIDALLLAQKKIADQLSNYTSLFEGKFDLTRKTVLITGHRRENFGKGFEGICSALETLSTDYPDYNFVYPVHLNPNVKNIVEARLSKQSNIYLLPPLPYDQLIYLMGNSHIILTDSGGIQEEAPSLNKPVLVMRDTTERPEGVDAGCCKLVGTDEAAIVSAFRELADDASVYESMSKAHNPYGDGTSADQIVSTLLKLL